MPPKKLGNDLKTIRVKCPDGHEVARYRKPRAEWGERTHKLWLIQERLGRLSTEPPILIDSENGEKIVETPDNGTKIYCGSENCSRLIGEIAVIKGTPAIELVREIMKQTKG
jgi:hypothetical protein